VAVCVSYMLSRASRGAGRFPGGKLGRRKRNDNRDDEDNSDNDEECGSCLVPMIRVRIGAG
jgi:ribosomal protein L37AE/L43A